LPTPYIDVWNVGTSSWDAVDIAAAGIADIVLGVTYDGVRTAKFTAEKPQYLVSIGGITDFKLIRIRSSDYNGGGGLGVDPVFEGRAALEPGSETIGARAWSAQTCSPGNAARRGVARLRRAVTMSRFATYSGAARATGHAQTIQTGGKVACGGRGWCEKGPNDGNDGKKRSAL